MRAHEDAWINGFQKIITFYARIDGTSELGEESVNEPYLAQESTDDEQRHHPFRESAFF